MAGILVTPAQAGPVYRTMRDFARARPAPDLNSLRASVCFTYLLSQPPTLADEHRGEEQLYVKVVVGLELGFNPRSTQANSQPFTQLIFVSPLGASTTNSKAGADV